MRICLKKLPSTNLLLTDLHATFRLISKGNEVPLTSMINQIAFFAFEEEKNIRATS